MLLGIAATGVLLLHLAFILFVAAGALLVLRWQWLAWLHVPAAAWGVYIELSGGLCPLTTVENRLRRAAGDHAYTTDFIDHYVTLLIYPPGLTRPVQVGLAVAVLLINAAVYGVLLWRRHRRRTERG